jgi:hypothetical protein
MADELTAEQRRHLEYLARHEYVGNRFECGAIRVALAQLDAQTDRLRAIEAWDREYRVMMTAPGYRDYFWSVGSPDEARWAVEHANQVSSAANVTGEIQSRVIGPWTKHEEGGGA